MSGIERILNSARRRDPQAVAALLADKHPLEPLLQAAREIRHAAHGERITYSPKVFIPLTRLCRDNCGYCTFATPPRGGERAYMTEEEVVAVAQAGVQAGCSEALFTLGDRPERRYKVAREELAGLGFGSTVDYLAHIAGVVLRETGLLPHINCGVLSTAELTTLRGVSASQGLMLEQLSPRLLQRGQAHWASPDKRGAPRLQTVMSAGELDIPFTTGMLVGIGETLTERADTIVTLAELSDRPHVMEIIVQNFRAKPGTRMAAFADAQPEEFARCIAVMRLTASPRVHLQAPPNLFADSLDLLLDTGIDDWGGVSPVTPDHVNPEAAWPQITELESVCQRHNLQLAARLPVYPEYLATLDAATQWLDPAVMRGALAASDAVGLKRSENWAPGTTASLPGAPSPGTARQAFHSVLTRAEAGAELEEDEIRALLEARGDEVVKLAAVADAVRREICGDVVTYVINRNINYTNICYFRCQFCAFSKGRMSENLRGKPQLMEVDQVVAIAREAVERGATEVCMQGGIHPDFTGDFYVGLVRDIKAALPSLHIHAFSPLEVFQGAQTAGRSVAEQLRLLREAGLGSLPGTAAEVLDDRIRRHICPDKLNTVQWLDVVAEAHRQGLPTTSTLMFGSVDGPEHWARHLVELRELQRRTGGVTEFVPLPFVHMEAPMFRKGRARRGPTWDEVVTVHATARLALRGHINNIQASWVKCGLDGGVRLLEAGCNDLGGTLMYESISRAAGAAHGQEVTAAEFRAAIRSIGRTPAQRTTLYGRLGKSDAPGNAALPA